MSLRLRDASKSVGSFVGSSSKAGVEQSCQKQASGSSAKKILCVVQPYRTEETQNKQSILDDMCFLC